MLFYVARSNGEVLDLHQTDRSGRLYEQAIGIKKDIAHIKEKVLSAEVAKRCQDRGQLVHLAATFGLNHVAVDDFNNSHDSGRRHMRVSATVFPIDVKVVAACISDVLKEYVL